MNVATMIRELLDLANRHRQTSAHGDACRHQQLVERIWAAMYPPDQPQWSPDTLDQIATVLAHDGYPPPEPTPADPTHPCAKESP